MEERSVLGFMGVILCVAAALKLTRQQQRPYKVRPINRARKCRGQFYYYNKMKAWDAPQLFKYTRMTRSMFEKLLTKIKHLISKHQRLDGICAEQRLVITLQYLSQGVSMQVLAWNFQIGHSTVHYIIHQTCRAIWDVLSTEYLKPPSSERDWLNIAEGFENRWNLPHCLGALDGKHVNIQAPAHSGSLYYNYKKKFSIVMLAACDSKYRFTMVDIGGYGSQSDGGVFKESVFGQKFEQDDFNVPRQSPLKNTDIILPYFLVGDEAFPLKNFIMRPYGGRNLTRTQSVFNYILSRARQTIENTFGIVVTRWRILKTTINAKPESVDHIIKAVAVLHNYCQIEFENTENNIYCPPGFVDSDGIENGTWRKDLTPLLSVGRISANYAKRILYKIRDTLAEYLVSPVGQVTWQTNVINRGLLLQN